MFAFPRVSRVVPVLLATTVLVAPALAQVAAPVPATATPARAPAAKPTVAPLTGGPWMFRGSDIRPNPPWTFGELPNGVRYAVRRNGAPPGQVSIRVRIDAGSMMETASERGLAHFIEHLSFRSSEYVADGEAKRIWQRLGATFGSDSNASTTPTQTVYRLDLPSATEAGIDESLKILSGMMDKPVITTASINAERPVVLAELGETPGPQGRVQDARLATLFAGQPLADQSTAASIKIVSTATAATVAGFHDRWYRPERTVIAISGDADPAVLEALVRKNFSGWTEPGGATPDADFGKPDPTRPATAAIVEPTMPTVVSYAVLRPWKFNADTILFNQNRMVGTMAAAVINRRLEVRARGGGSFLTASVSVDDIYRSANGTFVQVLPIGTDWQAALRDVRAVIADALTRPPTPAEIALVVTDYDTSARTSVETAAAEASAAQAEQIVGAVDIRETIAGPEDSYKIFTDARDAGFFTPARVFAATKAIFTGDATRGFIVTPAAGPDVAGQLATALKADVAALAARRQRGPAPSFASLPVPKTLGREVSRAPVDGLNMTEIGFANGVKLITFANKGEENRVYVRIRFGNGLRALPADRETPAWAGPSALVAQGMGQVDQDGLDRMTVDRRIGMDFAVDDNAFELSATTSPADLADQLRLMAAKLYRPRWDAGPVLRARAAMAAGYVGMTASPSAVLSSKLDGALHAGDPRFGTPSLAAVQGTTPESFRKFWEPLLASGPIEVQVFGDIDVDAAAKAVAASIGALPPRPATPPDPAAIRFPAHVTAPVVAYHDGNPTQAAAVLAWPTGGGIQDIVASRRLEVLAAVFSDRLFEGLRQASGLSYSPSVGSSWPRGLPSGGRVMAVALVPPDKTDLFLAKAREIAADLVSNPIGADELARVIGPIGESFKRAGSGNQFWMLFSEGATRDPKVYDTIRTIGRDYGSVTPTDIQATAIQYLRADRDWSFVVLPTAKITASAKPAP